MPKRNFFIKESELDDFQVQLIQNRIDIPLIVKGCAGSGKSILALWRAKQIQEANIGSYLFITFTKTLKQYMADGISQIGLDDDRITYDWYWQNKMNCQAADYIIIDEVQDFSKSTIDLFKEKAKKALILFGDSAQQLYENRASWSSGYGGTPIGSMEAISVHLDRDLRELSFNHRLPKKIGRFVDHIHFNDVGLEIKCKNEGTEKPKVLRYDSLYSQLDAIAEIIKNRNFEDVGILFRHNDDVRDAYKYLSEKGLNVEAKYDDKKDYRNNKMTLNFNSDNPKLMTYHSSKGLQFEAVFLPECTCSDNDDKNPLYVALTRTYQSLYIMHSGNLSSFFDAVPTNLYETSLTSHTELL